MARNKISEKEYLETIQASISNKFENEYSIIKIYKDNNVKYGLFKHNSCGFEFRKSVYNFMHQKCKCPLCNKGATQTKESFELKLSKVTNSIHLNGEFLGMKNKHNSFHCDVCNGDFTTMPFQVLSFGSCPYCSSQKLLPGFNDLATTHPELQKFLKDKSFGVTHMYSTHEKTIGICPCCGYEIYKMPLEMKMDNCNEFRCPRCGDGISQPEKLMMELLHQLKIDYVYQLSKKDLMWCNNYRYDFYIPKYNTIIEVHGEQHYKNTGYGTAELNQENDKNKKLLAIENGVSHYITVNNSSVYFEDRKNNILNSELAKLFDLSNINWDECFRFSISSILRNVCDKWNDGMKVKDIAIYYHLNVVTVRRYLKNGTFLNLCNYTPRKAKIS